MAELRDKIVLVTGGAAGLGQACAERFERAGATVVIADIAAAAADTATRRHVKLDVTSEEGWASVVADIDAQFGRIDVLLNAAGIALDGDELSLCTPEVWQKTMAVNLDGTFLGCKYVSALMRRHGAGSIINIASIHGAVGDGGIVAEGVAAYSASKAGVKMLTKSAALHLARINSGVRCNVILPGYFATQMVVGYVATHKDPEGAQTRIDAAHPMGRMGRPEELTGIILYLASDRSAAVTGAEFVVDGGYLAR